MFGIDRIQQVAVSVISYASHGLTYKRKRKPRFDIYAYIVLKLRRPAYDSVAAQRSHETRAAFHDLNLRGGVSNIFSRLKTVRHCRKKKTTPAYHLIVGLYTSKRSFYGSTLPSTTFTRTIYLLRTIISRSVNIVIVCPNGRVARSTIQYRNATHLARFYFCTRPCLCVFYDMSPVKHI